MNYLSTKRKFNIHIIFLFILSLHYLIPYFIIGQLTLDPFDLLDSEIVYNHVIGKIYRGDFESLNLFIAGEFKWYLLRRILQPLTLFYAFLETETAYWVTDIIIKLISYICFFKLSKKLNCSTFDSAMIGCLFASIIDSHTSSGVGIAALPYLIYLITKNKNLSLKNFFIITFIGLNTDIAYDIFIIPLLLFISFALNSKYQKYNLKIFLQIAFVLLFCICISNINLIYTQLFYEPLHRTVYIHEARNLFNNFYGIIKIFFFLPLFDHPLFFQSLPFSFYIFPIILISLFLKNKKNYLILLIIFFMALLDFILSSDFVVNIRNNSDGLISSLQWKNMKRSLPVLYLLVVIGTIGLVGKKIKYLIYTLIFVSLIASQIRISIVPIGKYLFSFNELNIEQKNKLRKSFYNQKYTQLLGDIMKFNKSEKYKSNIKFKTYYTFDGYYNYNNYKFIKSLVGDSRTLSIGLDPMAAVMNNIKVLGGYHNAYPLSYKLKFRKIIEKQLDYYEDFKNYYDSWGSRIYTYVPDPKIIKINFQEAKSLGAEYIISKYLIYNKMLQPVCEKCNGSPELFLYKIKT